MLISLLAATVAALGYGIASVLQAAAARHTQGLSILRQPLVLAGFALDAVAWLAALVALRELPLFVVQAVQASSLVVVVILAMIFLKVYPRARDIAAVVAIVAALAVLAMAGGSQPSIGAGHGFVIGLLISTAILVAGAAWAYRKGPAWLLAAFGGLGYGGVALAARGAEVHGIGDVIQPLTICLVLCSIVGILSYLTALERGSVGPATAILSVVEVAIPSVVGVAWLGDTVRVGWAMWVVLAIMVALTGCIVLAASDANRVAA